MAPPNAEKQEQEEEAAYEADVFNSSAPKRGTNRSSQSSLTRLATANNRISRTLMMPVTAVMRTVATKPHHHSNNFARNPAVAAKDTSQLTLRLFSTGKCHACKRQFHAEVGRRRYCRCCGEIFCFECCSDRVRLRKYHSRIGVLKNNTAKSQLVCRVCMLTVLGQEQQREEAEQEEALAAAPRPTPPELPPRPGGGRNSVSSPTSRRFSLTARQQQNPQQPHRKLTLDKYMDAVKHGGVNLERGFKSRLQAKHATQPKQVERSMTRAKTLRDVFFDGIHHRQKTEEEEEEEGKEPFPDPLPILPTAQHRRASVEDSEVPIAKQESFAEMKRAAQASKAAAAAAASSPPTTPQTAPSWGEYLSNLITRSPSPPPAPATPVPFFLHGEQQQQQDEVAEDEEDDELLTLEQLLQTETLKFRKQAAAKDESEERNRQTRVQQMLGKLTEVQATKISEFQRQTAVLDKQLRQHARFLEQSIRSGRLFGEDGSTGAMVDLRDELRTILLHLDNLQLESVFPACLRWKLKAKIEDGLFVGVRDLDIGKFVGDFAIHVDDSSSARGGGGRRLVFSMSNIQLDVALYEFEIRGDTAKAKVLRSALAPTLNRVELSITGEWTIPLLFVEGGAAQTTTAHSRWVAEKSGSSFTMRLAKTTTTGGEKRSKFQLPDSFLQWFASSLLPSLVESQILAWLPTKALGPFLCGSTSSNNKVRVRGRVQIHGDTTPQVWKAPLVGLSEASELARRSLGFQSEDEAFIFDYILGSQLAQTAGFEATTGSISLAKLYAWRLRFAAHSLASLAPMLAIIEAGSKMKVPKNWTLQLLRRMDELAAKPMTVSVHLYQVDLDLDVGGLLTVVTGMYLEHVEENVAKETEMMAYAERKKGKKNKGGGGGVFPFSSKTGDGRRNSRSNSSVGGGGDGERAANPQDALRAAKEAVNTLHHNYRAVLVPLVRDEIRTQFNAMIAGGSGGLFAFGFTEVCADVCLPSKFTFRTVLMEAVELSPGFVLKVNGKEGLDEGEYGFRLNVLPVGDEDDEEEDGEDGGGENDVETMFKNVNVNLFAVGRPKGAVHVSMDAWRSTVLISSLIKLFVSLTPPATAAPASTSAPATIPVAKQTSSDALSKDEKHVSVGRGGATATAAATTDGTKELMTQSRRAVENLWGSFRAFELELESDITSVQANIAGVNPLSSSSSDAATRRGSVAAAAAAAAAAALAAVSEASLSAAVANADDDDDVHQRVLMPYLTNDAFALHIDVRGLVLGLKKTVVTSGNNEEGIRLTLVSKHSPAMHTLVSFSIRINLQDVFQSDLLPV